MKSITELLAHSAPPHDPQRGPQLYVEHSSAVSGGAYDRAICMLKFAPAIDRQFAEVIRLAGQWHDLGKLDPLNQAALAKGRQEQLPVDHVDAGVAHLIDKHELAAWLVRAHHSPGLPECAKERLRPFPLRGARKYRDKNGYLTEHRQFIEQVDAQLNAIVELHRSVCSESTTDSVSITHGLPLRLALSCLVDADHEDTATFDRRERFPEPPKPRWEERIDALDKYVASLKSSGDTKRQDLRDRFYSACSECDLDEPMVACTGPVGIGKTTAVLAYLLRVAKRKTLRRIFIVAPYTNIITQTVDRIRKAIVLDGELPEEVVVEHHHRADYGSIGEREFATRWQAPIVVTTAVQFFETLSSNRPGRLRKLHEVPGSAVFLDEAHAAIPVRLWPQCWQWLNELASLWGCHFVYASGSLIEFWTLKKITKDNLELDRIEGNVSTEATDAESKRIVYRREPNALSREQLCERILSEQGPRLVILNTVQSAAVVARTIRERGMTVFHLSTALCPSDREAILQLIDKRFKDEGISGDCDWTLVATSCVEAGVDLSFQSAFREACSVASLIQVGGRVNRHSERGLGAVISFRLQVDGMLTQHPDFQLSADILDTMFMRGELDSPNPTNIVTKAMRTELKSLGSAGGEYLQIAEEKHDYPLVAKLGRVITSDTKVVVVSPQVIALLESGARPDFKTLLRGSVQLWATKINTLGLDLLPGFEELYIWKGTYDPHFLGYMDELLKNKAFLNSGCAII